MFYLLATLVFLPFIAASCAVRSFFICCGLFTLESKLLSPVDCNGDLLLFEAPGLVPRDRADLEPEPGGGGGTMWGTEVPWLPTGLSPGFIRPLVNGFIFTSGEDTVPLVTRPGRFIPWGGGGGGGGGASLSVDP